MEYLYWILLAGVLIAVMIIPQRRQMKKARQIRESLHTGMKIRTAGGFLGTIISVSEETVVIECSPDKLRLEILKGAVMPVDETVKEPVESIESEKNNEDFAAEESIAPPVDKEEK